MQLPAKVRINEEGPREGFQFEDTVIPTARKIELIEALSRTGLQEIQVASFVDPKRVPAMADAEAIVQGVDLAPDVRYTVLCLNEHGLRRALKVGRIDVRGSVSLVASEAFCRRNVNRTIAENLAVQRKMVELYQQHGIGIERISIQAAFGCNFQGAISIEDVMQVVRQAMSLQREYALEMPVLTLADTMAWATPVSVKRLIGAVRAQYPAIRLALHLHDTRGMAIANAMAGLECGIDIFDTSIGGMGGCPFAGHKGAAGNICTEDLVFLCDELGIETGVDLDKLIAVALLAEKILGRPLPGSVKTGGPLARLRRGREAATPSASA